MQTELSTSNRIRHAGPPLGIVATVFVLLFLAGLYPVTLFGGQPYFPGPGESGDTIVTFFQTRSAGVLATAFLHFGAAIPLGIFTATVVSRLQFLGARVAGSFIALCGELSWINLIVPTALFLVPLTRFPGFVWIIAAGFALPNTSATA